MTNPQYPQPQPQYPPPQYPGPPPVQQWTAADEYARVPAQQWIQGLQSGWLFKKAFAVATGAALGVLVVSVGFWIVAAIFIDLIARSVNN